MRLRTANWLSFTATAISFVATAALYSRLPERVPTHWNWRGEIDGWTAKPWGPFLMPLITAFMSLLLAATPRFSPRRFGVDGFARVYALLQLSLVGFLVLLNGIMLATALGTPFSRNRFLMLASGLLFVILGNFFGKLTKNFFIGIRTPWTLANDEVWLRTHRLGGKLFVAAGLVALASGAVDGPFWLFIAAVLLASLVSVLYSFFVYRALDR